MQILDYILKIACSFSDDKNIQILEYSKILLKSFLSSIKEEQLELVRKNHIRYFPLNNPMENTYSLWLKPSGNIYHKLAKIIKNFSDEYSAPLFEPHVTLIGGLINREDKIVERILKLINLIEPIKVNLKEIGYLNEYYRCLFLKAEETPSLMDANLKAREIFGCIDDTKFLPHLSLLYGNFDSKLKEEILKSLGDYFDIEFQAKSIHLVFTGNQPKDWYEIKKFLLK